LPPEKIATELSRIGRRLFSPPSKETEPRHGSVGAMIVKRLRDVTGVDFSQYRLHTILRRATRRSLLRKIELPSEYLRLLEPDAGEVRALYSDILVSVTRFFRDPEAFEALAKKVFPKLTRNRSRQDPVRIWALGCSTGEEAYSLAMAFMEF